MANDLRTVVAFGSDSFNLAEPRDYFINPCCFGDDLGKWLAEKLVQRGASIPKDALGQEDFGWHLNYEVSGIGYCLLIGNFEGPEGPEGWFVHVERDLGFLRSILGQRNRNLPERGVSIIHTILDEAPEIRDLGWLRLKDFARREYDERADHPTVP